MNFTFALSYRLRPLDNNVRLYGTKGYIMSGHIKKQIGIIGVTGRMGSLLNAIIAESHDFAVGDCYSKSLHQDQGNNNSLREVFSNNNIVIDFSSSTITKEVIESAILCPKPLVLCVTGWDEKALLPMIESLSMQAPVLIAPNTSIGSVMQNKLACLLAKVLDESFDIDIEDVHHRHKKDAPSGTAKLLMADVIKARNASDVVFNPYDGTRPDDRIGLRVSRAGNIPGRHRIEFTNYNESINIEHNVFNPATFAYGAIKALCWLNRENPKPGLYTMHDVYHTSSAP
jgi:4-hydroxy-tetrahydrodipicolinate reductase